ncbi:hypothetical protein [Maridesulfovibrio sp. FT414]|uniref:hypothetical protein n=1 Tax=Maridesulfovibrio sp. FT414 TaxID=2979469 RepID=UPI003D800C40
MLQGKFLVSPALRLICRSGERRKATQVEIDRWMDRVHLYRFFKGHALLWKEMGMVREFEVMRVEAVELGRMNP